MKVDRKEFLARCEVVKPALRSSTSMPTLSYLWFREGYVYAFDGGMGIACALPPGADIEGGLLGSTLLALLDSTEKEVIELAPTDAGFELKMGGSKSKLASVPSQGFFWNFPSEAPEGKEPILKVTKEVVTALKAVLPVKHESPHQAEHHGVVVDSNGEETWFITTDTKSMAAYKLKMASLPGRYILPRAFTQEVIKYGKEGQLIWNNDGILSFFAGQTAGQIKIHSNALDTDEIKDLIRVITVHTKSAEVMVKIPEGFDEALKRATILARKEKPVINLIGACSTLTAEGAYDHADLEENMDLEDGETLPSRSIRVNADLLKRGTALAMRIGIGGDSLVLTGDESKYTFLLSEWTGEGD